MKRTKHINHANFRKVSRSFRLAPVTLAIGAVLMLSGCESSDDVDAVIYKDAQECIAANPKLTDACNASYQQAVTDAEKTAPKYATKEDCEAEFGAGVCEAAPQNEQSANNSEYRQGSSMWMPLMMGYMMGRMTSGAYGSSPMFSSNNSRSPAFGKFVDSTGKSFGNVAGNRTMKVDRSAFAPKPATTTTITRGGFGQSVAKMNAASASRSTASSTRSTSSSRTVGG